MTAKTPAGAGDGLPHAQKALRAIAESQNYAQSTELQRAVSERRAWVVSVAACALALVAFTGWAFAAHSPIPAPALVLVDKLTGDAIVAGALTDDSIPDLDVLDQHWAETYIRACESYHYNSLQEDFAQCARMSSEAAFKQYAKLYSGPKGKQLVVGDKEEDSVQVVSVRGSLGERTKANPVRHGQLVITFDKTVKRDGKATDPSRYVSVCQFEYHPEAMKKPVDRIENPLGFICNDAHTDADLVRPTAPATPAASAAQQVSAISKTGGAA